MSYIRTTKKNEALQLNNEYLNNPKLSLFEAAECKTDECREQEAAAAASNPNLIQNHSYNELKGYIKDALIGMGLACPCTNFEECVWGLTFAKIIWILHAQYNNEGIGYIYQNIRTIIFGPFYSIRFYDNYKGRPLRNRWGEYPTVCECCRVDTSPFDFDQQWLKDEYCGVCGGRNGNRKKGKRK